MKKTVFIQAESSQKILRHEKSCLKKNMPWVHMGPYYSCRRWGKHDPHLLCMAKHGKAMIVRMHIPVLSPPGRKGTLTAPLANFNAKDAVALCTAHTVPTKTPRCFGATPRTSRWCCGPVNWDTLATVATASSNLLKNLHGDPRVLSPSWETFFPLNLRKDM